MNFFHTSPSPPPPNHYLDFVLASIELQSVLDYYHKFCKNFKMNHSIKLNLPNQRNSKTYSFSFLFLLSICKSFTPQHWISIYPPNLNTHMSNPILSSHLLLNYLKKIHASSVTQVFRMSYELCAMMVKVMHPCYWIEWKYFIYLDMNFFKKINVS